MNPFIDDIKSLRNVDMMSIISKLANGSQFSYKNVNVNALFNEISRQFNADPTSRDIIYNIVSQLLYSSNYSSSEALKLVNQWIDRFPSLIEASLSVNELSMFHLLLVGLLDNITPEISNNLSRVMPKFVNTVCRLSMQPDFTENCLEILETLLTSDFRHVLTSSMEQIRQLCRNQLNSSIMIDISTSVLSKSHVLDNSEVWAGHWNTYCVDMLVLVQTLGLNINIRTDIDIDASSQSKLALDSYHLDRSTGLVKGLSIQRMFEFYSHVVVKVCRFFALIS